MLLEGITSDETKTSDSLITFYFGKWWRRTKTKDKGVVNCEQLETKTNFSQPLPRKPFSKGLCHRCGLQISFEQWKNWAGATKDFNLRTIPKKKDNFYYLQMKGGRSLILLKKTTCLPDFQQERAYLYKNVQGSQRNDHSQKDWCGKSNRKHCTNNSQKGPKKRCHRSGHHVINTTDVLGEAVHNPPLGGGLKEWHRRVHDVDQHFLMEMPRGNSRASRHCNGSTKNEESLWHAQRAINTKEKIALFVWSHIRGTPLSQPDSWRDCRGLGDDEKQYDTYGERNCEWLGVFPEHWKFNLQEQHSSIWTICVNRFPGTVQAIRKLLKLSQRRQWVRCTTHVQKMVYS